MILQHPAGLGYIPKRIISLVPSQTELLYDLGLNTETVGITKFCVHPPAWFNTKHRIGGTKNTDLKKVRQLQPDLIIANKEENVQEQVEMLALDFPVWVTDVYDLDSALGMMADLGRLTGKIMEATEMIKQVNLRFNEIRPASGLNTAYLIWREPYMAAGGDTFIHDMLDRCGLKNIYGNQKRYPQIQLKDLAKAGCRLLLLSSEPYPFKQKHIDELQNQLPSTKILLADGELFSWYGSRMLQAPAYFMNLHQQIK